RLEEGLFLLLSNVAWDRQDHIRISWFGVRRWTWWSRSIASRRVFRGKSFIVSPRRSFGLPRRSRSTSPRGMREEVRESTRTSSPCLRALWWRRRPYGRWPCASGTSEKRTRAWRRISSPRSIRCSPPFAPDSPDETPFLYSLFPIPYSLFPAVP